MRAWVLSVLVAVGAATFAPSAWADPPTEYDRDEIGDKEPDHKFALMINPLDALVGVYGGECDFVLLDHLVLTAQGAFYNINGSNAMALGTGAMMFPLTGALHGWYVDPQVVMVKPLNESPVHFDWHNDGAGFGVTSGWQWTWDYGFALRLGAGAMYYAGGGGDPQSAPIRGAQPVLEGMLGWAF
jgi:hypothetical protein